MGSRDHSIECETCHVYRGGLNDLKCMCDESEVPSNPNYGAATYAQADAARALIDSMIYPGRDFEHAWDNACLQWGRFGEAPAKIALLEAALAEACEIAMGVKGLSGSAIERLRVLKAMTQDPV